MAGRCQAVTLGKPSIAGQTWPGAGTGAGHGSEQYLVVVAEPVSAALLLGTGSEVPAEAAGQPLTARRAHGHAVVQAARGISDHTGTWGDTQGQSRAGTSPRFQEAQPYIPLPVTTPKSQPWGFKQCQELHCPPRMTLPHVGVATRSGTCGTQTGLSVPVSTACSWLLHT